MKRSIIPPMAVLTVLLIAVQLIACATGRDYYLTQLTMSAYYAVVVMALCLVMGYTGQISLGHGAFFAIGGYTSAALTTLHVASATGTGWGRLLARLGVLWVRADLYGAPLITVSPGVAFVVALFAAGVISALIGYPALRLKGHYLAMATLGFGLIVYRIVLGSDWTGAADGITGVPAWQLAPGILVSGRRAHRVPNFYVAWTLTLLVLALLLNVVRSRMGRAFRAIHDDELAANAMGVNTARLKLVAFVFSAVLSAAAGCFLTHYNGGIGPSEASAMKSVRYVALVAAGGMANLWGVLLVSVLLNFLSLRGYFGTLDHAVFGVLLIAIVSLTPGGTRTLLKNWIHATLLAPFHRGRSHGSA